jgi:two-component system, cell cycle response regulator DivK
VRPHILLVEDSVLVVGALRLLLEETGHRVSDADSVDAAARVVRADPPDLILLDLTLGRENGLSLLPAIGVSPGTGPIVIAVTGHDDSQTRERCLAAGCREVLVKPIQPLALKGQIVQWLAERAPRSDSGERPASEAAANPPAP